MPIFTPESINRSTDLRTNTNSRPFETSLIIKEAYQNQSLDIIVRVFLNPLYRELDHIRVFTH